LVTDFIVQLITTVSVNVALSGLLLWITKSWISERLHNAIKNEYDLKLESHKAQLQAQSDLEIEKLRSQLSISAMERHVLFSRLHEVRGEVIAETYALLKRLYSRLNNYVKPFEPVGDSPIAHRRNEAADAHNEFRNYYTTKLIFLPVATATKLEEIDHQIVNAFNEFTFGVEMTTNAGGDGTQKWIEVVNRVNGDIKTALGQLEDEFRKLLGGER